MPGLEAALKASLDAQPRAGDDALLARVRERLMAVVRSEAAPRHRTVRAGASGWHDVGPGVQRKLLWSADGAQSCLMRLAPGVQLPAHGHALDEECLVLEGTLRIEPDLLLGAGDFHVAARGSAHGVASTDTGALVYLRKAREEA